MGSLEIEIVAHEGRGYKMAEAAKKENREIGYMEIDSVFSPVTLVSIDVENTRVGKMTNWDKLILNVKTDGTITPENAFNEAVKILVEQFNSLLSLKNNSEEIAEEVVEADLSPEGDEEVVEEEKAVKKEKKEKKEKKVKK
jgi:DNA-directed RNA polymerase subunit alpha